MRLLNTTTLELEEFVVSEVPITSDMLYPEDFIGPYRHRYAILSHTWGEGEVLFQDITNHVSDWSQKKGADKVRKSCEVAKSKGYEWIWIDTCCIDKSSSAELSESINSMFKWYEDSAVCIAYLADVLNDGLATTLSQSRWFERGWTLQELIAPSSVEFYDRDWVFIDTRFSLSEFLASVTRIDELVLRHGHQLGISSEEHNRQATVRQTCCSYPYAQRPIRDLLNTYAIANVMSWASWRRTTRPEDMAYCMFGLFNVNMPLLYGEGGEEAFLRLQKSIIQKSNDQSILAWQVDKGLYGTLNGLPSTFAPSPLCFLGGGKIHPSWTTTDSSNTQRHKMKVSEEGLAVTLLLCPCDYPYRIPHSDCYIGFLDCGIEGNPLSRLAIILARERGSTHFVRADSCLYKLTPDLPTHLVNLTASLGSDEALVVNTSEARMESIHVRERDTAILTRPFAPTLIIGNIVDQDSEKCSVEYVYPTIEDVRSWHASGGQVFLCKLGYPRFIITWSTVGETQPVATQRRYMLRLSLRRYNPWPGEDPAEWFQKPRRNELDFPNVVHMRDTSHSIVLAGPAQRKITARITDRTFLGRSAPELTVEVTPVTEEDKTHLIDTVYGLYFDNEVEVFPRDRPFQLPLLNFATIF